jgi:hypothetical protein
LFFLFPLEWNAWKLEQSLKSQAQQDAEEREFWDSWEFKHINSLTKHATAEQWADAVERAQHYMCSHKLCLSVKRK